MNWLYKLAAWLLSRDATGVLHTYLGDRAIGGWVYGKHRWFLNLPVCRSFPLGPVGYTGPSPYGTGWTGPKC